MSGTPPIPASIDRTAPAEPLRSKASVEHRLARDVAINNFRPLRKSRASSKNTQAAIAAWAAVLDEYIVPTESFYPRRPWWRFTSLGLLPQQLSMPRRGQTRHHSFCPDVGGLDVAYK